MTEEFCLEVNVRNVSCDDDDSLGDPDFKCKTSIDSNLEEQLRDIPGALEHIQKLERLIGKYLKKIIKLKNKIKKGGILKNASTQTDFDADEKSASEHYMLAGASQLLLNEQISLADDIKDAAEMAMKNTGFVYEETSGMYYDYNTGYYYNAEYGLYYDGSTGTYLKYNQDSQSYEFHSQVSTQEAQPVEQKSKIRKKRKNKCGSRNKDFKRQRGEENAQSTTKEFEEGECSDSGESSSEERADSDSSDISKQWPPCMRVIVETTECLKLKVGSLHIITCDGGTIGREGHHSILVPEINASKHHLKITFDKETGHYCAVDLGSRNGTLLNGKRISPSKQESAPVKMVHGSRLQIGSTVFLCHIHEGSQTCGHCEPGLLQSKDTENEKVAKTSKLEKHKNELKNLKMLCGVDKFEENPKLALGYTDRAQKRRQTVGSQNPHEKTEMASVDECINKENKGFKLLAKMGWKEGQSLGKGNEGLLEPVRLVSNKGTSGIGCSDTFEKVVPTEKHNVWKKTQERFEKLPNSNNAFEIDSED